MGLAAARLPVSKDRAVVSQQDVFNEIEGSFGVDWLLFRVFAKNIIKSESLNILIFSRIVEHNLIIEGIHINYRLATTLKFLLIHGPDPDHNLD
jgi:hypothetical protein